MGGEYVLLDNGFRIRAERHETDGPIVRLFTEDGRIEVPAAMIVGFEPEMSAVPVTAAGTEVALTPDPRELLEDAAARYGLPAEFLHSVAAAESGYRADAVSPKGAIGVMQLMPATAAELGANPWDPQENIDAGARRLRDLLLRYEGGTFRALAAYNAGQGAVDRYGGIPPYRETRLYVEKVLDRFQKLTKETSAAERGGSGH